MTHKASIPPLFKKNFAVILNIVQKKLYKLSKLGKEQQFFSRETVPDIELKCIDIFWIIWVDVF